MFHIQNNRIYNCSFHLINAQIEKTQSQKSHKILLHFMQQLQNHYNLG